jgi:hypothetical protein
MASDIAERCDLCGKVHTQPTPNYCRVSPRPNLTQSLAGHGLVIGQITSTLEHLDVPHFPTQQWQKDNTGPLRDKLLRRAILASGLAQVTYHTAEESVRIACDMDREIERVTREEK